MAYDEHDPAGLTGRGSSYTDDQILDGLRGAASLLGEPLSAAAYEGYARQHEVVSSVRVIQRWGTWNTACAAAGLTVNATPSGPRKRWTEEQLAGHVADYLESPGAAGSYADYRSYAIDTDGAPSAQTVRNTFGSWSAAKAAAEELLTGR